MEQQEPPPDAEIVPLLPRQSRQDGGTTPNPPRVWILGAAVFTLLPLAAACPIGMANLYRWDQLIWMFGVYVFCAFLTAAHGGALAWQLFAQMEWQRLSGPEAGLEPLAAFLLPPTFIVLGLSQYFRVIPWAGPVIGVWGAMMSYFDYSIAITYILTGIGFTLLNIERIKRQYLAGALW